MVIQRETVSPSTAVRYIDGVEAKPFIRWSIRKSTIPPIVRRMTGITNRMVKKEPVIEEVMPKFLEFLEDDFLFPLIGDMKFLESLKKVWQSRTSQLLSLHTLTSRKTLS